MDDASQAASEELAERVAVDVLLTLSEDVERRRLQPLAHYLARHAGHEEIVAREYLAVTEARRSDPDDGVGDDDAMLGPYRLERELGRGGQGVVYKARDTELSRWVALKVLHRSLSGSGDQRLRFQREAELTGQLDHPGLCTVFGTGRDAGRDYIAMRLVEGPSLAASLAETRAQGRAPVDLPGARGERAARAEEPLLRFVARTARALHAAHESGVIHRDIKPSNILVADDGQPVLLDFGLARAPQQDGPTLTAEGDLFGTPAYMSPEQLAESPQVLDRRTDVYSLGVVLYEGLTLERPFQAPTLEAQVALIRTRDAPSARRFGRHVSRDLDVVLATALERDVARRYQSAADLADDLQAVVDRRPIRARPAGPWLRLLRWSQRQPALAASLGLTLIAAAVLWIQGSQFRSREDTLTTERDQAIDHMTRLSDSEWSQRLLDAERDTLWPVGAALEAACDDWLVQADALLARRGEHQALLDHLHARRAAPGAPPDLPSDLLQERLTELLGRLDTLAQRVPIVSARLQRCAALHAETVERAAGAWADCAARLALDERFAGLALAPQEGLVPLGANSAGLWEFWHVESGARPVFDDGGSGSRLAEGSGICLVLIPGGTTVVGCHREDGPNVDPGGQTNETPPVTVQLAPYFLSKYELTQDQWAAVTEGQQPSAYLPGSSAHGVVVDGRHPVEQVSFHDGSAIAARYGLQLPTEAQWEHAARAGTHTPWSWGLDWRQAARYANCHGEEANGFIGSGTVSGYRDAYVRHAPAGAHLPNGFGLHDMHGNVWEWCADPYADYDHPVRDGDGWRLAAEQGTPRAIRGGSFTQHVALARCARRAPQPPDQTSFDVGLRLARPIDPPASSRARR